MLNKSRIMLLWMSLCLCCFVLAQQRVMAQAPKKVVETVTNKPAEKPDKVVEVAASRLAQAIMKEQSRIKKENKVIADLIEQHLIPIVDQEIFAMLSLGKDSWDKASKKQRQDFIEGFKKLLIKSYSGAFKAYNGEKMTFKAPRYNKKNTKAMIISLIHVKGESPVEVRYMLHKKNDKWLMYNVIVNGFDLVRSYRVDFSDQITKYGLDKTIAKLKQTEL